MRYDEFIGQVQHRAGLGSHAEAERATRATLETLAERLAGGEAHDLAARLRASSEAGRMVTGGSGVLSWAHDEERDSGHPNHGALYPGEQGTGQGKA